MMESSSIENGIVLTGRGILIYRFALNDSTHFNWLHVAMHVAIATWLYRYLLCLFTAHYVTIYS